jgi:hypothetical protein
MLRFNRFVWLATASEVNLARDMSWMEISSAAKPQETSHVWSTDEKERNDVEILSRTSTEISVDSVSAGWCHGFVLIEENCKLWTLHSCNYLCNLFQRFHSQSFDVSFDFNFALQAIDFDFVFSLWKVTEIEKWLHWWAASRRSRRVRL